jgi:O-antigen/teichoic acid export membrane protein
MWQDARGTAGGQESAGTYAGRLLQRVALAALWAYLVLPAPGDLPWALVVAIGGTLAAYLGMQWVAERWAPGRREHDAAGLVWATALPVAVVALLAALWSGA